MKKDINKTSRKDLINDLRKQKKELQEVRFRTSPDAHAKTSKQREIKKTIAKIAVALNSKEKSGDKQGSSV